jgi:hypothetical protein
MNADFYEGLHLFNDAMYKATLYLEAVSKSGAFKHEQLENFGSSICRVRSATNLYLIGVIQEIERQRAQSYGASTA